MNKEITREPIEITEDVVAQFLLQHPDFFQQHPELLNRIKVNVPERGVVSLVEIQINQLRERIRDLENEISDIISLATKNDRIFHDFVNTQKNLFMCDNFVEAAKVLEQSALSLNLTAHIKIIDHSHSKYGIDKQTLDDFIKKFLNGHSAYLGRLRPAERDKLFSCKGFDYSGMELGSFAVLPLGQSEPIGVIAFASCDGSHFEPSMDTLFLEQLVSVFYHLLTRWFKSSDER